MSEKQTIEERVIGVVADQLGFDDEEVTAAARLIEDLGADSLDEVELVMGVEEEFGIEIPDEVARPVKTVADLVKIVEQRL